MSQLFHRPKIVIKWKLIAIILLTSIMTTGLTLMLYTISELFSYRLSMQFDLQTLARVVGNNTSAALTFDDPDAAEDTLSSLAAKPDVKEAAVYTASGDAFAVYRQGTAAGAEKPPMTLKDLPELNNEREFNLFDVLGFFDQDLEVLVPVEFDRTYLGAVYLKQDASRLKRQIVSRLEISLVILGAASILAFLLANRLQRLFTAPILLLAGAMRKISREKDYAIRLEKTREDEIGILIDGFNQMLSQIQERDRQLAAHQLHLEEEVKKQTADLRQAMKELKQAKEAAEASDRSKSAFLANMSHELRTPLNHIIGFTELIVDKRFGELNEVQEEHLNDVLTSSRHLLALINDILDLSKIESGKVELNPSMVNLKRLLTNSLSMIKEKAMNHDIALTSEMDGIPDVIPADERKLKQIMYNLLSNAAKFTPDGGEIRLAAKWVSGSDFGDNEDKAFVEISVSDTGIGIRPEDLERIFESFEQVEMSLSRKYQGTGLGLALTRQYIELHGGRIWAESRGEGFGSRFRFLLPL